ncbi:hypothetical protein K440DRAFT_639844 [Wilcoxina mikolae CBS 423.85]|nr:hypothetical protein K440DRAFT_639844 [Wilcoxina mikolae CBS 423.85]
MAINSVEDAGKERSDAVGIPATILDARIVKTLNWRLEPVSSSNIDLSPSYSSSSPAISNASATGHGLGLALPHASLSTPTLHSTLGSQSLRLGGHGLGMGNGMIDSKTLYHPDTLGSSMCDPASSIPLAPRPFYDMGNDLSGSSDSSYPYILSNSHSNHGLSETSGVGVLQSQHSEFPRHWSTIPTTGKTSGGSSGYFLESEATSGISNISQIMTSSSSYVPTSTNRMSNGGMSSSASSSLESYPTIFPALTSLSSSLPEGGSRPSISLSDKVLPPLPTRIQSLDFGSSNIKGTSYSGYTDSSGASSNSHSRASTTSHRSPTVSYVTSSPSMQIPSSQRSTPTLIPSSASIGSSGNYVTSSSTSSGSYNSGILYSSNQPTLMGSSVDQMPVHSMLAQKQQQQQQQQRTDSELSLQQYQSTPRSSAHVPAPPLHTSSSSSTSSNYQTGDQHRGGMGLNKVY